MFKCFFLFVCLFVLFFSILKVKLDKHSARLKCEFMDSNGNRFPEVSDISMTVSFSDRIFT